MTRHRSSGAASAGPRSGASRKGTIADTEMAGGGRVSKHRRASARRVSTVLRQLAALLNAGSPIVDALGTLESQVVEPRWRKTLGSIRSSIEEGHPLSDAMSLHPWCFDGVCRGMVEAGESAGKLPELLDRYARLLTQESRIRRSVFGALMYPCVVLVTGLVMLSGMLVVVLPKFKELFDSLDAPLPMGTAAAMWTSASLRAYWWVVLVVAAGVVVGVRAWVRSGHGRRAIDTFVVRGPHIGVLARSLVTARLARLLGTLVGSYLPILEVLQLAERAMGNTHYRDLLARAQEAVSRGETISSVLSRSDLLTPSVREILRTGEQTGRLGPLLLQIAESLDEDNETMLRTLTGLLEPIMLLLIGILVAIMALIVYLPLFDIATTAGSR